MGFLETLFGPSRTEIWKQLATELQGRVVAGGWLSGTDKVQVQHGDWTITLDTYNTGGKNSQTYTRLRTPYRSSIGLQFNIYRAGFFSGLGKMLGMQDIDVGYPEFDDAFVIKGNNEALVRELFGNARIRQLLQTHPDLGVESHGDEGWFGRSLPRGIEELYFRAHGVITDLDKLHTLYDLFAEILNQLGHMDPACEDSAELHLARLATPGEKITDGNAVLFDGNKARCRAAHGLGVMKERRAVPPLVHALSDDDPGLVLEAAWALGEIGDPRAVYSLVPLLGTHGRPQASPKVATALRKLGQAHLVKAFNDALSGQLNTKALAGEYRSEVIEAFIRALDSDLPAQVIHAAQALAALHAVEALPALRAKLGFFNFTEPGTKAACAEAVGQLEGFAALPRPAAASVDSTTLPRAPAAAPASSTLPRETQPQ